MALLAPNPNLFPPVDKSRDRYGVESCAVHDHLCLIYSNREEQLAAVIPFIRTGLDRGEKCLYVVDENVPETIVAALRRGGVDVDAAIDSGALAIANKWDAYLKNGNFDPDWMIRFLEETIVAAEAEGYTAFRVTGETTWTLGLGHGIFDRLMDYECKVNEFFRHRNVLAICQYNRNRFRPETLLQVIRTHPLLVCGETVCENPHYLPPEAFHDRSGDAESEVQRLLDNIVQNAHLKQSLAMEAEALRESEQRFRAMVDNSPECVKLVGSDGALLHMNAAGLEMIGAESADEVVGKSVYDLVVPEHRDAFRAFNRQVCNGEKGSLEFDIVGLQGTRRHLETHAVPFQTPDGDVAQLALTRDITERRREQEALRESETRFRTIFEQTATGIAQKDLHGRFLTVNDRYCEIVGRTREGLMGLRMQDVTHPDDIEGNLALLAELAEGKASEFIVEKRYVRPDRSVIWVRDHVSVARNSDGIPIYVLAAVIDITERKQAEDLLMEQKQVLELIAAGCSLKECLNAATESASRLVPNARAAVLMADAAREKLERTFSVEVPGSVGEGIRGIPICELAIGTCSTAIFQGKPVTCADVANDERWAKAWRDLCVAHGILAGHSTPVFTAEGKAVASFFLGFGQPHEPSEWEIGVGQFGARIAGIAIERDRAAQALRESDRKLASELADMRQLQRISAEIQYDEDADGLYKKILDAAVAIMHSDFGSIQMLYPERGAGGELRLLAFRGFSREAARLWEWIRIDSTTTCGVALRTMQRAIVSDIEQCGWMADTDDLAMFRRTGIRSMQTTPLISRGGNLLGMISTHWREPHQPSERCLRMLDIVARQVADLIERKLAADRQRQAEIALRKSEKLAGAGRMAATIAHEINNPLEAMTNLWYLLNQEKLSPEGQLQVKMLGDELGRVSHITKQTLEFYREGKTAGPVDLIAPIDAAVKLFSRKAEANGTKIEAQFRTSATLYGFAGELRQVFANLIGNSLEAGASTVKIRVSPTRGWGHRTRRGVRVTFSDNGSGIPAELTRKLFEPFFTTKEEKGTGLGLWVSKGIVQKHEGSIRVRSSTKPGRSGTTFSLFLPTLQDSAVAPRNVHRRAAASA